jgi:hypothetical protein
VVGVIELINVLEKELLFPSDKNNSMSYISDGFGQDEKEEYYKGLKHLILAKAFEIQENKAFAVENYKQALRCNAENYEAFDRLISNFLITNKEKEQLIADLKFNEQNLWLKDYYVSRINQCLVKDRECEGLIVMKPGNQSSLCGNMDESGISPSRFHSMNYLDDSSEKLRRNPARGSPGAHLNHRNLQKANQSEHLGVAIGVIDVL